MPTNPGSGAACHTFVDEAHPVVIVLDQPVTCEQAREIGKAIGSKGFTARFIAGTFGDYAEKCAAYMKKHGIEWQA